MRGILLVNKPKGFSSYDVIREIKRLKIKGLNKIGHAGTLDPIASGLLILLFNEATKIFSLITSYPKVYRAKIRLGLSTDTDDITGRVLERREVREYPKEMVMEILKRYEGEISQIPPSFSALKEKGVALYKKARRGEAVLLKPRKVKIFLNELLSLNKDTLEIRSEVSKGTYIRALARDIGKELGCGGVLEELVRERIGRFSLTDAQSLPLFEAVIKKNLISLEEALYPFPEISLNEALLKRLLQGKEVFLGEVKNGYLKVFSEDKKSLILAKGKERRIRLERVLYGDI